MEDEETEDTNAGDGREATGVETSEPASTTVADPTTNTTITATTETTTINEKKRMALSKMSFSRKALTNNNNSNSNNNQNNNNASAEGSEKITSSSENEVEEIPKDEDEGTSGLQVGSGASPFFGRSHTFDASGTTNEESSDDRTGTNLLMARHQETSSSSRSFSHHHHHHHHQQVDYRGVGGVGRPGLFAATTRSPHSSSSQEDYEPECKGIQVPVRPNQLTTGACQVIARSMESLGSTRNYLDSELEQHQLVEDSRSLESLYAAASESHAIGAARKSIVKSSSHQQQHQQQHHQHQQQQHHHHHHQYRSFLTSSKLDVRRIHTAESKSSENLHRASSSIAGLGEDDSSLKAEVRRGLFASLDRKKPQHLSLPPPNNFISLTSPGGSDRRIHILSPHSPVSAPDFHQTFSMQQHQHHHYQQQQQSTSTSSSTLKVRRRKQAVLPRLVLASGESPVFE